MYPMKRQSSLFLPVCTYFSAAVTTNPLWNNHWLVSNIRRFPSRNPRKTLENNFAQQVPDAGICGPSGAVGGMELNPCGLVANSMFNDMIVVGSAPEPFDPLSPYDYMDESGISWVTGERE